MKILWYMFAPVIVFLAILAVTVIVLYFIFSSKLVIGLLLLWLAYLAFRDNEPNVHYEDYDRYR